MTAEITAAIITVIASGFGALIMKYSSKLSGSIDRLNELLQEIQLIIEKQKQQLFDITGDVRDIKSDITQIKNEQQQLEIVVNGIKTEHDLFKGNIN